MRDIFNALILPLFIPIIIGMGSSAMTSYVLVSRIEERLIHIEKRIDKQEVSSEYLRMRTEEQERHIVRLDGAISVLAEIKSDIKALIKGK